MSKFTLQLWVILFYNKQAEIAVRESEIENAQNEYDEFYKGN